MMQASDLKGEDGVPLLPDLTVLSCAWLFTRAQGPSWAESGRARVRSLTWFVLLSLCLAPVSIP